MPAYTDLRWPVRSQLRPTLARTAAGLCGQRPPTPTPLRLLYTAGSRRSFARASVDLRVGLAARVRHRRRERAHVRRWVAQPGRRRAGPRRRLRARAVLEARAHPHRLPPRAAAAAAAAAAARASRRGASARVPREGRSRGGAVRAGFG
jgi:hypothetical protein